MRRRRRKDEDWVDRWEDQRWNPEHVANAYRGEVLARYNAEVARGIVHTAEWDARMAAEQDRFNEAQWADQHPLRPTINLLDHD